MTDFKTLDSIDNLAGKNVLVRVDLNVPVRDGTVTDTTRIERVAPTLRELSTKGARVILLAHFGRPDGHVVETMSLRPIAHKVEEILDQRVHFATDCIGEPAQEAIEAMTDGDILLLENVRFHPGEEKNDAAFAAQLAQNGDIYVNDAFSAAHRAHASTEGIAHLLPSYAGRTMQAELEALEKGLGNPARPVVAIVGGAKVATAKQIMIEAAAKNCAIVLPVDGVVAEEFKAGAANQTVDINAVPANAMILDLGPKSVATINDWIAKARTLVWNGPLGAFEIEPFDAATVAAARFAAQQTCEGLLTSVAGGGDTVAALNLAGVTDDFTYVSTAGGAFLEWMEGKPLPGVNALKN